MKVKHFCQSISYLPDDNDQNSMGIAKLRNDEKYKECEYIDGDASVRDK